MAQTATPPAPAISGPQTAAPKQPVTVVPAAADAQIADRLQKILQSTGWFKTPRVSVRDGVVFLDAVTDTAEHRRWAGALAENTQGTVAVVNRIEVKADVRSTFGRAGAELARVYRDIFQAWPLAVLALIIAGATWLIGRLVAAFARRFWAGRVTSPLLLTVVVRAFTIPIFLLGAYFMLQVAGLTRLAVTVLGGTGLIGVIIGFAFRDIAENFLASLLLSVRNPFRSGDLIEVGGYTGIVQNLNTRSTVLLTLDDSAIARAQAVISQILRDHPAVLDTPEPLVLVDELGAATVNLRVRYWFDSSIHAPDKINSALLRLTKRTLIENGIELPDAAREVIFPKGVPLLTQGTEAPPTAPHKPTPPHVSPDETSAATTGEGNLSKDTGAMPAATAACVPEATENLLKE